MKRLTLDQFVSEANEVHGSKYNYSSSIYKNYRTKLQILCNLHGSFWQTPARHLDGYGCTKCGYSKASKKKRKSSACFISEVRDVHGDKYDYAQSCYVNDRKRVGIICFKHGKFFQVPNAHLRGEGCPKCAHELRGLALRSSTEDFIQKSQRIHKNKYDYSDAIYVSATKNVIIRCPRHGKFHQTATNHLSGKGCPKCAHIISNSETKFLDYVGIGTNNRNKVIGNFRVDGYDPTTQTIYEFLGDYWHGHPEKFDANEFNKSCKKTYGELYYETIQRFRKLKTIGYGIKYIWETDWKAWNKNKSLEFPIKTF